MKLSHRVLLAVLITAVGLSLMVGLQWRSLDRIALERELVGSASEQVNFAHKLNDALTRQLMELAFYVNTGEAEDIENFRAKTEAIDAYFAAWEQGIEGSASWVKLRQSVADVAEDEEQAELELVERIREMQTALATVYQLILDDLAMTRFDSARTKLAAAEELFEKSLLPLLSSYVKHEEEEMSEALEHTKTVQQAMFRKNLAVAGGTSILILSLVGWLMVSLRDGMSGLTRAAGAYAKHDYAYEIGKLPGDFAQVGAAYKQMARDLNHSTVGREYLDAVFHSIADAVLVLREDQGVAWVNPEMERLFGADSQVFRERPIRETLLAGADPPDGKNQEDWVNETARRSIVRDREMTLVTYFGETIPVALSAAAIKNKLGRFSGTVAVVRDLREVKRQNESEQRLVAQAAVSREREQAAKEANRAKSEFLAAMSHEIRTPLNGVLGAVDLILRGELTASQRRFAETVQRSGEVLLSIIGDILDFSKIEAGRLDLEQAPFDLRELVGDIGAVMGPVASQRGIDLKCLVPEDVPATYRGDPTRLRQVLINLVSNAVKFTAKGQVALRVRCLADAGEEALLQLEVADTGIGIAQQALEKIFEAFSQADRATTRRYGGTGLGLAISKRLVNMMGGTIDVDSELGRGTTFRVTLRLAKTALSAARADEALTGALRVLIAVDSQATRAALGSHLNALRGDGLDVAWETVSAGADALLRLAGADGGDTNFEVIFVDGQAEDIRDSVSKDVSFVRIYGADDQAQASPSAGNDATGVLTLPLRRSAVYDCLVAVTRRREKSASPQPSSCESPTSDDVTLSGRILLAEDHPVNQDVEVQMLKLLGLEVTVAENGRKALDALATGQYDAVLMDCDMPEMDGYEATGEYRRREQEQGAQPLPIIALTANALQGDREKCLRAGMDDYISKPLNTDKLRAVLQQWLPEPAAPDTGDHRDNSREAESDLHAASEADAADEHPALDADVLAGILELDADGGFLAQLAQKYADSWVRDYQALQGEIRRGDAEAARKLAHRLKSSSANLGALGVAALCQELESALRAGRLDGHQTLLDRMTGAHDRARAALTQASRRVA